MNWLGKVAYYLSLPGLHVISRSLSKQRARVLVVSPDGRVLLVKTWFGRQRWSLPGGGLAKGETAEHAAVRELYEETGIGADAAMLSVIGELQGKDGLPFNLKFFLLHVEDAPIHELKRPYRYEIIARQWVFPDQLPDNTSPTVVWALKQAELITR